MATSTLLPGSVLGGGAAEWRSRRRRTWFQQGGSVPSGLCLAKAAVGAGVLTMVTQCANVGLAVTTFLLVVGVILTVLSIRMIGEASIATRSGSFEDICDELLHNSFVSFFTGWVNAINGLGESVLYLSLCGQVWVALTVTEPENDTTTESFWQPGTGAIFFCGLVICIPLSVCRKITVLRYIALVSLGGTFFLIAAMFVVWRRKFPATDHNHSAVTYQELWFHQNPKIDLITYMNVVNTIIFAYNSQSNVPQLTGELESEAWNSVNGMAWLSSIICFVIYELVAAVGVLTFGFTKSTEPETNLVKLLSPYRSDRLGVSISLVAIMMSLMCCLEFHIFPVRQFFGYCLRKARGRGRVGVGAGADEDHADQRCCRVSCTRWLDIFGGVSSVVFATVLAAITHPRNTNLLISILGGFGSTYTCYIIPSIWILALRRRDDDFSIRSSDVLLALAMLVVGVLLFVFGTTAAILQAIQTNKTAIEWA